MAATIKDIAKKTGLSVATISKFINGGNVLENNRIILEKALVELDYHINEHARALKTNKSHAIGFVVPKFSDVFASSLASEAVTVLQNYGYSLLVCESHSTIEGEEKAFQFLASKNVDGMLVILVGEDSWHYKKLFARHTMPVVSFDLALNPPVCDAVIVDNADVSYRAVRQLIEAGHKEIAIVRGPKGHYTADQRYQGFAQAMEESGLSIKSDYVLYTEYDDAHEYERIRQLFSNKNRPTAVFTVNFYTTMSTIMALNELEINVPEEVSVFGFDYYDIMQIIKPHLWLAVQPFDKIARQGVEILMRRIQKQEAAGHQTFVLPAVLREGNSVAKR